MKAWTSSSATGIRFLYQARFCKTSQCTSRVSNWESINVWQVHNNEC